MSAAGTASARLAHVLMWLVPALWSSNYIIARLADGVIAPHLLALGRWTLAALLMLPFTARALVRNGAPWRREWKHMLVLGALGMWICGAFVYQGGQSTSSINIALIYAATPIAIVVASSRLLHERLHAAQLAGMGLALAGLLFVIAKGDIAHLLAVRFTTGDLWIVAAAVSWAAYSVLLRLWPSSLGPFERLVVIVLGGVVVLLPFTLLEWWVAHRHPFGPQAALLVVLAAVLPGVLSYGAYSFIQRELGASRTSLMLYLAPVYGAVLAWLVLGEVPGWYHGVGALLILPSIWLATRRG